MDTERNKKTVKYILHGWIIVFTYSNIWPCIPQQNVSLNLWFTMSKSYIHIKPREIHNFTIYFQGKMTTKNCQYLSCLPWRFDICIHCEMIPKTKLRLYTATIIFTFCPPLSHSIHHSTLFPWIQFFGSTCVISHSHAVFIFLCLIYFTSHNLLPLCCCRWEDFLFF
jgi:hypothetical protein